MMGKMVGDLRQKNAAGRRGPFSSRESYSKLLKIKRPQDDS